MPAMEYARVAELYDAYVQTDIDVPFFLQEARGCKNVLELTSGTGRLSLPLLQAGVPLSCLDSSPDMLAVLRKKLQKNGLSAPIHTMDLCTFRLPEEFDLILIPFNAFAEICEPEAQQIALTAIRSHLADNGHLIVTLHNPAIRLKNVDGRIRLRGKYPLPGQETTLSLLSFENYDPVSRLVRGAQIYEIYAPDGTMQSKIMLDLEFYVHNREGFEELASAQGFARVALYGDYEQAVYQPDTSPFMIWILKKL